MAASADLGRFIGRSPDHLSYAERVRLNGVWIALEIYTPATLPLRKIEAIGATPGECIVGLRSRGLDVRNYELQVLQFKG